MKHIMVLCWGMTALLTGCVTYRPAPVSWSREIECWGMTNKAPVSVTLTLEKARRVALIGNLELNAFRLKHVTQKRIADATGWWQDPVLSVDALDVLKDHVHPFAASGSLLFTIPLSGVPGLKKAAAGCYVDADRWAVLAAERELTAKVDAAIYRENLLAELAGKIEGRLHAKSYVRALEALGPLSEAGEVPPLEAIRLSAENRQFTHEIAEIRAEWAEARQEVLGLLGIAPDRVIVWKDIPFPPAVRENVPTPIDLVDHPAVRERLARLGGDEKKLEAEIRRQYPELSIGPAGAREEGKNRIGLSAELSLPLWNRNRLAIAEAEASRDTSRLDAIREWRRLVLDLTKNLTMRRAIAVCGDPFSPGARKKIPDPEKAAALFDAGELDAATCVAQTHAAVSTEQALGKCKMQLAMLRAEMKRFERTEKEEKAK